MLRTKTIKSSTLRRSEMKSYVSELSRRVLKTASFQIEVKRRDYDNEQRKRINKALKKGLEPPSLSSFPKGETFSVNFDSFSNSSFPKIRLFYMYASLPKSLYLKFPSNVKEVDCSFMMCNNLQELVINLEECQSTLEKLRLRINQYANDRYLFCKGEGVKTLKAFLLEYPS
eukprot:TRINITY_DN9970_c0_g1_i2.p1 TRINITY_DN9970_c0_g1~~TRINITY_DN9970_c0_g1_i2.p1  ORF type:complete len:172 (-),score=4.07 TRINITY_DN9970_c0_g1_i2:647-1162(-)